MNGYVLPGPLALSRATVDRAASRRNDDEWLAAIWRDESTRVLVVGGGYVRVNGNALAFVAPGEAPDGDRFLLGVADGVAYTAVHVPQVADSPASADQLTLREAGTMLSDRDAGLAVHALALANWHETHTYCPRCGRPTHVVQAGHVRRCAADGSEHHPRVDPAVIMLVVDGDERCLLGRQRRWPARRYSTLAGFVEPGETPEQAVVREVGEEVSIVVDRCRYAGSQPWPFPSSLMLAYYAQTRGGTPQPDGDEIEEARWFTRDEFATALATEEIRIPPAVSVAHRLIQGWYGGPLDDGPPM